MAKVKNVVESKIGKRRVRDLSEGTLYRWDGRYGVVVNTSYGYSGVMLDHGWLSEDCLVEPLPAGFELTLVQE